MKQLNTLERDLLIRKIAQNDLRIKGLENILQGQPIRTVKFADAVITAAKIAGLSADKITTGTISVGEQILIHDGTVNRIMITHDVFAISKPGVEVTTADKKDLVILNQDDAHKLKFEGYITSGSHTHGLGKIPVFFCFQTDSTSSPTYFRLTKAAKASTTQITGIPNPSYLLVYREGA